MKRARTTWRFWFGILLIYNLFLTSTFLTERQQMWWRWQRHWQETSQANWDHLIAEDADWHAQFERCKNFLDSFKPKVIQERQKWIHPIWGQRSD